MKLGWPSAVTGEEYGVTKRLRKLLSLTSLRNEMVLDIGCGFGAYSSFAEKHGASFVIGVDLNRSYLSKAENTTCIVADASKLPIRDSSFDVVLMIEVLDHLPIEETALQEARRVLRKKGLLLVTVPHKFNLWEEHGLTIGSTEILGDVPLLSWMPDVMRVRIENARVYTVKRLHNLLRQNGFLILKVDYIFPPLDRFEEKNPALVKAMRDVFSRLEKTPFKHFAHTIALIGQT